MLSCRKIYYFTYHTILPWMLPWPCFSGSTHIKNLTGFCHLVAIFWHNEYTKSSDLPYSNVTCLNTFQVLAGKGRESTKMPKGITARLVQFLGLHTS